MNKKTITQLNQLNHDFYQLVAKEFSESRNYYWQAWDSLTSFIKSTTNHQSSAISHQPLKVLDIGCGNGRFLKFLVEKINVECEYIGIDNSSKLIDIAEKDIDNFFKEKQSDQFPKTKYKFKKVDFINSLINNKKIIKDEFDLIVMFGVMHHVPSFELRKKLVEQLGLLLKTPLSLLIITCWQFTKDLRFAKKNHDPKKVGINPKNLEINDFVIDWQRGKEAFRYFHFIDEKEFKKLIEDSNLKINKQFYADGGAGKLNLYEILQKI